MEQGLLYWCKSKEILEGRAGLSSEYMDTVEEACELFDLYIYPLKTSGLKPLCQYEI